MFLNRIWGSIAERASILKRLSSIADPALRAIKLAEELLSERGEATSAARAEALVTLYRDLDDDKRHQFHLFLARNFLPEPNRLQAAAQAYLSRPTPDSVSELTAASTPPRQELLRRMNTAPGATAVLVKMREALLKRTPQAPELRPLEQDLHHLLSSWFNRGFLELRLIDWTTSAMILERLIAYEAVHEIRSFEDLRQRLGPERRCFAYFHPAFPDEPLIFVEVALCHGLAGEIAPLLAMTAVEQNGNHVDTAVFYSINNCQPGLRGISFGNFLIKNVVEELSRELPRVKCFATLSPVPSFRRWLDAHIAAGDDSLLHDSEHEVLGEDALKTFATQLANNDWQQDNTTNPLLKPILQRLCAKYLTLSNEGRGPNDPVARFHLGNGAQLERINWRANTSARGIAESYGLMVNYRYDPDRLESNHEKFVSEGRVAHSTSVAEFLRNGSKSAYKRSLTRAAE